MPSQPRSGPPPQADPEADASRISESLTSQLRHPHHHEQDLLSSPIQLPKTFNPLNLALCEPRITSIDTVIHIVANRIALARIEEARRSIARVLPRVRRAATRALRFDGRVRHVVAGPGTGVSLEGVQKAEPVPCLVHGRHALVVAHDGAAGHAACGDVAAVAGVDAGRGVGTDVGGKGAFA